MKPLLPLPIAYVVKRYPRFSETFIVNEILAHEAAGWPVDIFSLGPCLDTHFQNIISAVRGPVTYLPPDAPKASDFWRTLEACAETFPGMWRKLESARGENVKDIHQAMVLALEARKRGIHHFHAHFATSAASVARLAARFSELPFSFTAHAKDIFHESVVVEDLRRKLSAAAAVVTVSDFNLSYLREQYGAAADRVVRLFNGLHLNRFPYQDPADRAPLIVAVGRLVEKKGFSDLLKACALLKEWGVNYRCQIVGSGEEELPLRRELAALGLEPQTQLIGPRPQSEIIQLVQSAAVMAAPCVVGDDGNRDGLPTVLLEAMALGTPCVSTPVTGIPEIIRDGETGLLVPERDPVRLARAMERLLGDADLRVRLATGARRVIEADFDSLRNAEQQRLLFRQCVEEGQTRTLCTLGETVA